MYTKEFFLSNIPEPDFMRKWIIVGLFVLTANCSAAQRFGGTPPGVHWKQISTDTARVIFPEGLDSQAQRIASIIHEQASSPLLSTGQQLKKIDIVLQSQTVVANGYVGLGPYRSEFYLTPPANNFDQGSLSWIDQLAIHEYRHVQQFNHFNNGLSRLMSVLFGEEGYALATNASIPDWFYEGDAVYYETISSLQGRGRLPLFMNAYPATWYAGKDYSWMKMRNGSLKDLVPGHYQLGYWLVNYGYEKYGKDFWSRVTRDASSFKGLFYPFQKAIKKYAGIDYKSFRTAALDYYKKLGNRLQSRADTTTILPAAKYIQGADSLTSFIFPVNKKYVTNYLFPYEIGTDSLLYLKRTYRNRPAFYINDSRGEHRMRTRDISIDDQFSYRNGKIVYAAYENDPRWRWRDYSVIKVYDIKTKEQRKLTKKSKYFTPDISGSGKKVVAVQNDIRGQSALHILDANNGNIIKEIRFDNVNLFTDPKFIGEDSIVTAIRFKDGKMALAIVDLRTNKINLLTTNSFTIIGYPFVAGNNIYFTASYHGADNIFKINLVTKKIYRVTNDFRGQYFVNASETGSLVWSVFTAEGYQLQKLAAEPLPGKEIFFDEADQLFEAYPVAKNGMNQSEQNTQRSFPVTEYSKTRGLLNFHSWRPYYEDPEFSFSLYGQNVLNTLETELYYLYNQNDKTNAVGFNSVYGGWFPYVSAGLQYTFDRKEAVANKIRSWNQLDARIGLSIPLSFTSGRTIKNFVVGTDYVFRADQIKSPARKDFDNSNFSYLSHRVSFSEQVESAVQHIYPALGYALTAQHRHAITNIASWQFLGGASLYLPGVASTHSIVLTGAFQQRDTQHVLFSNRFAYSRGYNEVYPARAWRGSANYHFPLFYPDWGFANILYLQRVRANCFFDFTKLYANNRAITAEQRSAGIEFYVDTKWWNQYELSFGFRVARLLDDDIISGRKETVFEFILPVSIFPK